MCLAQLDVGLAVVDITISRRVGSFGGHHCLGGLVARYTDLVGADVDQHHRGSSLRDRLQRLLRGGDAERQVDVDRASGAQKCEQQQNARVRAMRSTVA
jgi:hypothetical protein